jgi:hypothetical protein
VGTISGVCFEHASEVTIVARGPTLASSMSQYLRNEIANRANIEVRLSAEIAAVAGREQLETLMLRSADGEASFLADALFIVIGAHPHTDWLPASVARDTRGYVLTDEDLQRDHAAPRWTLERPPFIFETSAPGVFAVGDVRSRSLKRVAAAVGEGAVVAHQVHRYLGTVLPGLPVVARDDPGSRDGDRAKVRQETSRGTLPSTRICGQTPPVGRPTRSCTTPTTSRPGSRLLNHALSPLRERYVPRTHRNADVTGCALQDEVEISV